MHPCSNENEVEQLLVNAISDTITKSQIKIANIPSSQTLTILKIKEKMLLTLKNIYLKKRPGTFKISGLRANPPLNLCGRA